jgi:DNA-binding transcriptional regulator YhcF (GntR family)
MPLSPARELRQWILSEIAKLPPNTCLPPDRELGARWGLSSITVQRTLAKLRDEGKVIRIPGKGTFTPGEGSPGDQAMEAKTDVPRDTAVEHLTKSMVRMIAEGVYRKGKPLPPVKFIRNHFKVSSETVTLTYQNLERLGYVEKIGKSYWVGTIERLLSEKPRREVFFIRFDSADFASIFNSDPIALAFQKMERELYHSGYFLHPETAANLETLIKKWEAEKKYPSGLVFYAADGSHLAFFRSLFTRFAVFFKRHHIRILIHGQNNDLSELTRHAHVFLRGNVETTIAKVLARYLLEQGFQEANFCVYERELTERYRTNFFLKIGLSIQALNPDFVFRIIVKPTPDSTHSMDFLHSIGPEYRKYLEGKYPGASMARIEERVEFSTDVFEACSRNNAKLWIFSKDQMAAEGLQWLAEHGREVPRDVSVIGFQNDPRYYHLGISTCGPDWDSIGYVMAHALIGDIKQARSKKGFLRVSSHMLDKLTTSP